MANKRKLSAAEIAALLEESTDSNDTDSDFDDSDTEQVQPESDSDGDSDSGDAEDRPTAEFQWSVNATSRNSKQFISASGLQVNVNNPDDPLALFELLVTDELLQVVVAETTHRASQLIAQTPARPHSHLTL